MYSFSFQDFIKSAFQDIVSDELKKITHSSGDDNSQIPTSGLDASDILWEYDGLHNAYQGECEEILLEMQRIFYEDLRAEPTRKGKLCSFKNVIILQKCFFFFLLVQIHI